MINFLRTVGEELGYWAIGIICALVLCLFFGAIFYIAGPLISCILILAVVIIYSVIRIGMAGR